MSDSSLISITDLIEKARSLGVSTGRGDPREHLSYLSKVGLLPNAIKRKNSNGQIEGHYPTDSIETLNRIEQMKKQGLTFSQMKRIFDNQLPIANNQSAIASPQLPVYAEQYSIPNSQFQNIPSSQNFQLPLLIIGIILGYLLAINNGIKTQSVDGLAKSASITPILSEKSDPIYATLTRVITGSSNEGNETQSIYLISVPKSNLKNFGSGNIRL